MRRSKAISNEVICALYRGDGRNSMDHTAQMLGISHDTVRRALRGTRREPELVDTGPVIAIDRCGCCNWRPIWREGGLTRLCKLCWEHRECGEIYPGAYLGSPVTINEEVNQL